MRRILCLLLLPICLGLGLAPSALANWGSFVSTGTTPGLGNPSCAQVSTSHVVCAVLSEKAAMMINEFNETTKSWGKWTSLAGTISSDPSCTSDGKGDVLCAATATSGGLEWALFDGTTWTTPAQVKAALYSAPSCANYHVGEVLCVARNVSGGLAYTLYNGSTWGPVLSLSTTAISQPSCTTDNNSGVICAVFTSAWATEANRYVGGSWLGFISLGGIAGGEPDCTSMNQNGNVVCFAKSYLSGIYGTRYSGGAWASSSWTGYGALAGNVNDNASCTTQSAGLLVCGVLAVDNAFYSNVWNGSVWSGWIKVGGTGVGSPSCAPLGTGQVVCVIMGTKNTLTSVVGP